ncbi:MULTISPECIES: hypothetical protein [Enterobacter]|uniref:hypothetical protein n=1 Tax=Enterobacter TaxID=547 RepID=UPI0010571917|nr:MULTISPECIES: hypothetical protein [Enterobacter]MDA5606132.1 hypothetical protein [Enterobacter sp. PI-10]QLV16779.1 hypothetical protein HV150_19350 [Enterobacter roggenkampii]
MKRIHFYVSVSAVALAIILLTVGYWFYQHNLSFTCSSSTASFVTNVGNKPLLNFSQTLSFERTGKAFLHLSGELHEGQKIYVVNRTIIYTYSRIGRNEYSMHVKSTTIGGNDSVPELFEHKHLGPVLKDTRRIISVMQLPSGDRVIANNSGPYLICAVH